LHFYKIYNIITSYYYKNTVASTVQPFKKCITDRAKLCHAGVPAVISVTWEVISRFAGLAELELCEQELCFYALEL
jgi:hypothetical protein